MENKTTTLFLFTSRFPFGSGEAFLETEIKILSSRFSKVIIVPYKEEGESRELPENVEVQLPFSSYRYSRSTVFSTFLLFIRILFSEFIMSRSKVTFIRNSAFLKSSLLQNISRASHIEHWLNSTNKSDALYYSYWFDDWATILSVLKMNDVIDKFVSRAHRFDLYEELWKDSMIPFRNFQLSQVSEVYPVSEDGTNYLRRRYPEHRSKISTCYLGVLEQGTNHLDVKGKFTLVSCSFVIPVKRIERIVEALKQVSIEVNWTHFGGGPELEQIKQHASALPENIECHFPGTVENEHVITFYKSHSVDLFVNVSLSEGLPVSIQEAISFGIPVAATNVGGVSEIVNNETGFLLKPEFKTGELAAVINDVYSRRHEMNDFRSGVKLFWLQNFNAMNNYSSFCDRLLSLNPNAHAVF